MTTRILGDDPRDRELAASALRSVFASYVETGTIEVADRPASDVVAEFFSRIREDLRPSTPLTEADGGDEAVAVESEARPRVNFAPTLDHRSALLAQADSAFSGGNHEIAVVLWATWVEHNVNSVFLQQCRRLDVSDESARTLLRSVGLRVKLTALWELASLPPLGKEAVGQIDQLSSLRNSFVHYKWPEWERGDPDGGQQFHRIRAGMESITQKLAEVEEEAFWLGRRNEIMSAFDSFHLDRTRSS
ncbi:hypothetical protein [Pseudonocardia sp. D17]|uniref:hypothetical protein n=1 Tax=Pseudonocardia sp. D17 TaxID=882661 RepID=UPI002B3FC3BA|nr:hypothetical protein PSD17_23840 [Pseudonocardia sp. D17]